MVLDVVWVSYVDYLVLGVSIKGIESLPSCFISVSILKLGPRNKCRALYIQSTPPTTSLLLTQSYTPRPRDVFRNIFREKHVEKHVGNYDILQGSESFWLTYVCSTGCAGASEHLINLREFLRNTRPIFHGLTRSRVLPLAGKQGLERPPDRLSFPETEIKSQD